MAPQASLCRCRIDPETLRQLVVSVPEAASAVVGAENSIDL
jgi:hypothetical protein